MAGNRRAMIAMAAACALTVSTSCGAFRHGSRGADDDAFIYFTNESLDQAAVYASGAGASVRLGTVPAGITDTLLVPESFTTRGSMTVFVRFLARREMPSTGNVSVSRGSRLDMRLSSNARTIMVLPGY
jgi:hypothetical protein